MYCYHEYKSDSLGVFLLLTDFAFVDDGRRSLSAKMKYLNVLKRLVCVIASSIIEVLKRLVCIIASSIINVLKRLHGLCCCVLNHQCIEETGVCCCCLLNDQCIEEAGVR